MGQTLPTDNLTFTALGFDWWTDGRTDGMEHLAAVMKAFPLWLSVMLSRSHVFKKDFFPLFEIRQAFEADERKSSAADQLEFVPGIGSVDAGQFLRASTRLSRLSKVFRCVLASL